MTLAQGIYQPPPVGLVAEIAFPGIMTLPATIERIEKHAGAAVGSCAITFQTVPALAGDVGYGKQARVLIGTTPIFRGTVGSDPKTIGSDKDEIQLVLFDDKWGMSERVIGQSGIGTLSGSDKGFTDVGHEIVFNKDGLPNKSPTTRDFCRGSTATFWSLKDILLFIFDYYIRSNCATCAPSALDGNFDRVPSNVTLVGMNGLQAVDHVVELAGRSWGLVAHQDHSAFVLVKPGGSGTKRQAAFFVPGATNSIETLTEWHVSSASAAGSVFNCRDVHQARSGNIVIESTYSTETVGEVQPLLIRLTEFADKKFAARYVTDVQKYEQASLGFNLSSGAPAKPWMSNLVTRFKADGSGYLTAAEIAASPNIASLPRAEIPVWIQKDANSKRVLCVGGYEIDYENALIDFEAKIEVLSKTGEKGEMEISDWSAVKVWLTVATVTELYQFVVTDEDSDYLENPFYVVIDKTDLVPESRVAADLPDLAVDNDANAVATIPENEPDFYIDVTDELQDAADGSADGSPAIESPLTIEFPFFPVIEIGDALELLNRDLGETGDEVVISVTYDVHHKYCTRVEATNVVGGISTERFIKS